MNKENVNPEVRKDNVAREESAINKNATDGQEVNQKEVDKREQYQPRDNA